MMNFPQGRNDLNFKGSFNISYARKLDFCITGPQFLTEVMETLPGFEPYAQKMRKITVEWLVKKCIEITNQPASFSVLNHGDFHIRNMMFKRNEFNAISEIALVMQDFKMTLNSNLD